MAPSNDAWLRLYLRRIGARGAGLPERFLALLRRALGHYGLGDLDPSEALERALLRLYAAHARTEERYRLVGDLLRFVTRIATAGVDLSDDAEFADALGTCIALRGDVPDALADGATEARYTIFELPAIRRRAARATAVLERALAAAGAAGRAGREPAGAGPLRGQPAGGLRPHRGVDDRRRHRRDATSPCRRWCCASMRRCFRGERGRPACGGRSRRAQRAGRPRSQVSARLRIARDRLAALASPASVETAWEALCRDAASRSRTAVARAHRDR